jgi:hypothetical protein
MGARSERAGFVCEPTSDVNGEMSSEVLTPTVPFSKDSCEVVFVQEIAGSRPGRYRPWR